MKERGYLRRQISSRKKLDQQVLIYCWSKRTTVYSFFNQTALSISVLRISSSLTHSYVCLPKQRSLFFLRSCHCPKSFKSTNEREIISKDVIWLPIAVRWLTVAYRTSKCEIPIWIFMYLFVTKFFYGDYSTTRFSNHST